jgi:hypothetical protein
MPPRLTIEEVKETIEKEGCTLVSTEYKTNKKPLNILCSCGNTEPFSMTFMNFTRGGRCKACRIDRMKETNKKRYGYEYVSQRPETKESTLSGIRKYVLEEKKKTFSEVQDYFKSKGCKVLDNESVYKNGSTKLRFRCICGRKGLISYAKFSQGQRCSNKECMDTRKKQTNQIKFGAISYTGTPEYKEKYRKTCLEKYGTEHCMQSIEVQERCEKSGHAFKLYSLPSGKQIKIQGYEHLALDELLKTYAEHQIKTSRKDQPEIWWTDAKGMRHRYFSDMYIPHLNRIIEVKSSWTYRKGMIQGKLQLQKEACERKGYTYTYMIYDDFGNRLDIDDIDMTYET